MKDFCISGGQQRLTLVSEIGIEHAVVTCEYLDKNILRSLILMFFTRPSLKW